MTNRQVAAKLVADVLSTVQANLSKTNGSILAKLAEQSKLTQKRINLILDQANSLLGPLVTKMAKKGLSRPPRASKQQSLNLTDKSPELSALKVDSALANAVPDVVTSQTPEEAVPF